MLERALVGPKKYWTGLIGLLVLIGIGTGCYLLQYQKGLTITGMGRDVSWGFYIAQFTFLVGVAASAVMLVLPYYLHHYKAFGKITILGEFLAVAAVSMCLMFILADLGRPMRMLNVLLYPTPGSVLFWDMTVLNGYLFLNIIIGWVILAAERKGVAPPAFVKPLIYISIPWAVSIHTVTAFLYCGLPGRGYWLTAILAARFLSSAFAAGPSLLIILCLLVRKWSKFDPGKEPIQALGTIVTYAIIMNVFFFFLEVFTVFYSRIPEHMLHFKYLFVGLHGHGIYVPWMWSAIILCLVAIALLLTRKARANEKILLAGAICVFLGTWIDKGMGMIAGGFTPSPLEHVTEYVPSAPELFITLGVWATGFLILTILYKVAISVKEELAS
ncbi:MAG: polysulfide reductase NrfD [Deltaproteobacteria bacterium]|nr:polysulfide reductase NrfD [Deltaproteobacteria bacterium]